MLNSLGVRVLAQAWARTPVTFPFGAASDLEPLGWQVMGIGVYDETQVLASLGHWHRGTDFGLQPGTPVTVALSGRVTWAAHSDLGYGNLVTIEGARYKSRYAHLSQIRADLGEWIDAGRLLGNSGATGNVTGPHLHYEVFDKKIGAYVDPLQDM